MQFKILALATTSLVAAGLMIAPASAKSAGITGDFTFGVGQTWQDGSGDPSDFFTGKRALNDQFTDLFTGGRVNIPYSPTVNVQFDASGDNAFASYAEDPEHSYAGSVGFGAHLNYRDERGLLGIFATVGKSFPTEDEAPTYFAAGFEGQYFCEQWTFAGQAGWLDSGGYGRGDPLDSFHDAGFIRTFVNYYASPRLKLNANLAYADGGIEEQDATLWNWGVGMEYWFGNSVPVSLAVRYFGITTENKGPDPKVDLDQHTVSAAVVFHFGTADLVDADRNGPSADLPEFGRWVNAAGEAIEY